MKKPVNITVGDRVACSASWLRRIGNIGELPFLRGTVLQIIPFGDNSLCCIEWDNYPPHPIRDDDDTHDAEHPGLYRVLDANLTLMNRIAIDAELAS
jgi:hypothetical protein